MKISVNVDARRKVNVQSIEGGSVCGLNVDTIEYELTDEFDLAYKYAFLAIGENVQPVELDALRGSFTMPAMSSGTMRIAFRAFDIENRKKAHEVITEKMKRGIRIERHGKHSFGSMEQEANDVLAKMVQAAIDAKAAQVAAEAATTASIAQTSAAKAAEEQRETAFDAKMGEWNREIVDAISDANKATENAEEAAKNANDAATAAALAEVKANNAAALADVKAAAAPNAANAANASKASADAAAANANAKATLADQSAAKADQGAQGANAAKASADAATKAANDAAAKVKSDYATDKAAWSKQTADAAKQATDAAEDAESAAQEARDAAEEIPELMQDYAKQTELKAVNKVVERQGKRIDILEAAVVNKDFDWQLVNEDTNQTDVPVYAVTKDGKSYANLVGIEGKSLVLNQLYRNGSSVTSAGLTWTRVDDCTLTVSGTPDKSDAVFRGSPFETVAGHKYLLDFRPEKFGETGYWTAQTNITGQWMYPKNPTIIAAKTSGSFGVFATVRDATGVTVNTTNYARLIDLTLMFGSGNEPTDINDPNAKLAKRLAEKYPEFESGRFVNADVGRVESMGKNILATPYLIKDQNTYFGVTYTPNADGTITLNGTNNKGATFDIDIAYGEKYIDVVKVSKGEDITASGSVPGCLLGARVRRKVGDTIETVNSFNSTNGNAATRTVAEDGFLMMFLQVDTGASFNNVVLKPMVERGTVATAYSPYGVKDTIDLPTLELRSAISVKDRLDMMAGEVARKVGKADADSEGWRIDNTNPNSHGVAYIDLPTNYMDTDISDASKYIVSNINIGDHLFGEAETDEFGFNGNTLFFRFKTSKTSGVTLADGLARMRELGAVCYYPLKEPTTEPVELPDSYLAAEPGGAIRYIGADDDLVAVPHAVEFPINIQEAMQYV